MKDGKAMLPCVVVVAVIVMTAWAQAGAKAGGKTTNVGPWTCTATVLGSPGDPGDPDNPTQGQGITSDGINGGVYVHGTGGVSCVMYAPPQYTSSSQAGEFMLYFTNPTNRSLFYPANALSNEGLTGWATGFYGGRINVWNVSTIPAGGFGYGDVGSRATNTWNFVGDAGARELPDYPPSGTAYIVRGTNPCHFTVTMDPDNPTLALWTGRNLDKYSGSFHMPFQIVIDVNPNTWAGGSGPTGQVVNCQGLTKP